MKRISLALLALSLLACVAISAVSVNEWTVARSFFESKRIGAALYIKEGRMVQVMCMEGRSEPLITTALFDGDKANPIDKKVYWEVASGVIFDRLHTSDGNTYVDILIKDLNTSGFRDTWDSAMKYCKGE